MSFQEKNITVSLVSFLLILGIYLIRITQLVMSTNFTKENLFWLWGIVIVLAIVLTILGTILTHILSAIVQAVKTGDEEPEIDDVQDERDKLIDLKGTNVTYIAFSVGVFIAMLTFVIGQPALVMFSLLILAGILAQILGDSSRLYLYRRGF
jgi:hypothetical protein